MNAIVRNAYVSWKTSLLGLAAFITLNGPQIYDYVQMNWGLNWKEFGFGLAVFLIGIISRDGDKSSEQAGAGVTPPSIPHRSQWSGLIVIAVLLTLPGCVKPVGTVDATYNSTTGGVDFTAGIEFRKRQAKAYRDAQIAACKAATQQQLVANMEAFTAEQNRLCKQCKDCAIHAEVVSIAGEPLAPATILPDAGAGLLPESGTGGR